MGYYVSMSAMLDGSPMSGAEMFVNGVMHPTQANGVADLYYLTTLGPHTYESKTPTGTVFVTGEMALAPVPIPQSGNFSILEGWPEDDVSIVWYLLFQYETAPIPNQPPLAVASVFPVSGTTETAFQFSSEGSSDPDGSISSYHWDFGDGTSSTSPNPTHTFSLANVYDVELTVTDNEGAIDTDAFQLSVTPSTEPPADEGGSLIGKVGVVATAAVVAGVLIKKRKKG